MVNPVVQHVASWALTPEVDWNLVIPARSHVLKVLFGLFLDISSDFPGRIDLVGIGWDLGQLRDAHTFLHIGHQPQIDAVVDEGEVASVEHLFFHGHAHVGLAQTRVHFLPV